MREGERIPYETVSSWACKHNTISAFFAQYPTPTAALQAKPDEVLEVIRPLAGAVRPIDCLTV